MLFIFPIYVASHLLPQTRLYTAPYRSVLCWVFSWNAGNQIPTPCVRFNRPTADFDVPHLLFLHTLDSFLTASPIKKTSRCDAILRFLSLAPNLIYSIKWIINGPRYPALDLIIPSVRIYNSQELQMEWVISNGLINEWSDQISILSDSFLYIRSHLWRWI